MGTLEALRFDNLALRALPMEQGEQGSRVRTVRGACYSRVQPTPLEAPRLIAASPTALSLLDLAPSEVCNDALPRQPGALHHPLSIGHACGSACRLMLQDTGRQRLPPDRAVDTADAQSGVLTTHGLCMHAWEVWARLLHAFVREQAERPEFVEVMAGNTLLPGMEPAAHCYCGHQFGNFAGQLGDGAVIYLGEVGNVFPVTPATRR